MLKNIVHKKFFIFYIFALAFLLFINYKKNPTFESNFVIEKSVSQISKPLYEECFITPFSDSINVHSATITQVNDIKLLAAWFSGSYEGSIDTTIQGAFYDIKRKEWGNTITLCERNSAKEALQRTFRRIGNPTLVSNGRNLVDLFYVTTTIGGWATSTINHKHSDDGGETWSKEKRLITSPFFNISTLVRARGILHEDGSLSLPVYHECFSTYGLILKLDHEKNIQGLYRIPSDDGNCLQPSLVPLNKKEALAFLRYKGKDHHLRMSYSSNIGNTWTKASPLNLPNPHKSIAGIKLNQGSVILVFNNSPTRRDTISLAISHDTGKTWKVLHEFDVEKEANNKIEYSYPFLIQDSQGIFHLVYTWRRQRIKHIYFNEAWIYEKERSLE